MTATTTLDGCRELAFRELSGITVQLLWNRDEGNVWLAYADQRDADEFATRVPVADALEAFRHPNAFRPSA